MGSATSMAVAQSGGLTAAAGAVSGHQAAAYGAVRSGARPGAAGSDAQGDHGRSGGVGSDAEHFTLNQALSAPFSNGLTAAPAKARVAWVTDAEGRRDIWIAGREEAARQVTHTNADDGQDLDGIAWSADAEQIAWTRGTGAQGPEHPVANPAELPGSVKQNVEIVDLRANGVGGALRVIAEGHAPLFLRDGSALLFLRSGNIWIAELTPGMHGEGPRDAEKDAPGVRQLVSVRGAASGLRLSPDGRILLFVSKRGDHSFIGVYVFASKELRWMDPGVGLDHDAVWSPDGSRVAFVREVPVVSPIAERWMREGAPWSIRVAEIATGAGWEIWRANAGAGSVFHGVAARDQLLWLKDGRIVFPWERDGWTRLWALALHDAQDPMSQKRDMGHPGSSHEATLLTPGYFEVDAVASDGVAIAWSGNRHERNPLDEDRRHVWLVGHRSPVCQASPPTPKGDVEGSNVCGPQGIEAEPAILSDGTPAVMAGSPQIPLLPTLVEQKGPRELAPGLVPASFPAAQFVTPHQVVFRAADGIRIHGQLFLPRESRAGKRLPAVVFFHGGSRRQMLLGFHPMQYYAQAYEFNQYLASRGFAVLSVNYRSGTGYGLNFRQARHYGADGASEYSDVVGAAKYLASRHDIDSKRIGAWGGSYGGYLTALALARSSDLYAAGVDLHGVHDWSLELDLWKPTDEPGVNQAAIAKRAFASSPMADVKRWRSPVLLMQGDDDRNVLFSQTVRLAAALRARGVPVQEKVFPDEVHDFLLHRNWLEVYRLAAGFLEKNLQVKADAAR